MYVCVYIQNMWEYIFNTVFKCILYSPEANEKYSSLPVVSIYTYTYLYTCVYNNKKSSWTLDNINCGI